YGAYAADGAVQNRPPPLHEGRTDSRARGRRPPLPGKVSHKACILLRGTGLSPGRSVTARPRESRTSCNEKPTSVRRIAGVFARLPPWRGRGPCDPERQSTA